MPVAQLRWKPPRGFGNDLKGARYRLKEKPVVSEPLKREACDKILRKLPVITDVV
jgi:hypothetical protein